MNQLIVKPIDPNNQTTLLQFPVIGAEELILYVKNPDFKRIVYHVNISGGAVVMGFDEIKVLRDIEFNLPRKHWIISSQIKKPKEYTNAGLELIRCSEKNLEIDLPVFAYTNPSYSIVQFCWIKPEKIFFGKWYALSNFCFAYLVKNEFVSFLICLMQGN